MTLQSNVAYTLGATTIGTVTITDNDLPVVSLATTDGSASETGPGTGTFTISRTGPSTGTMSVGIVWTGTATSASDYTALATSVTIPAGQASVTVTVTPIDDSVSENAETVIATLQSNAAYTLGVNTGTVTIKDNDLPVVTITANDLTATEAGPTTGQFTVSRTGGTATALMVTLGWSGAATATSDYGALATTLTIAAGQATGTMTLTPVNDAEFEGDETVIATIESNAAYQVGESTQAKPPSSSKMRLVRVAAHHPRSRLAVRVAVGEPVRYSVCWLLDYPPCPCNVGS